MTTELELQALCRDFVHEHVSCCVSSLVYELAQDERHMDDLMPVLVQDDYEQPLLDEGWKIDRDWDGYWMVTSSKGERLKADSYEELQSVCQRVCESEHLEPYTNEAM